MGGTEALARAANWADIPCIRKHYPSKRCSHVCLRRCTITKTDSKRRNSALARTNHLLLWRFHLPLTSDDHYREEFGGAMPLGLSFYRAMSHKTCAAVNDHPPPHLTKLGFLSIPHSFRSFLSSPLRRSASASFPGRWHYRYNQSPGLLY
jgi:hypothetical protein